MYIQLNLVKNYTTTAVKKKMYKKGGLAGLTCGFEVQYYY